MSDDERHYHFWPDPEWGWWPLLIVLLLCLWDCTSGPPHSPIANAIAERIRS